MSAEPFDQDQPDDLAEWDAECADIDKGHVIADEEPWPVQWDALTPLDLDDDPRPEDERTPDLGPMRVAAAAAFISAGVAVVGAWHLMLWLLDVAVS